MTETDRAAFARGVSEAIKALRTVYRRIHVMFDELELALTSAPAPQLSDLGIRAFPRNRRGDDGERTLRSWMGRLYASADMVRDDEPVADDDGEADGGDGRKMVSLDPGQNVAYVKVELYRQQSAIEPQLLYGTLRDCRIAEANIEEFELNPDNFSRILEPIKEDVPTGEFKTFAKVRRPKSSPKGSKKKGGNHLRFTLEHPPTKVALFDVTVCGTYPGDSGGPEEDVADWVSHAAGSHWFGCQTGASLDCAFAPSSSVTSAADL